MTTRQENFTDQVQDCVTGLQVVLRETTKQVTLSGKSLQVNLNVHFEEEVQREFHCQASTNKNTSC